MAKGHTIPILQLAHLLLRHGAAVTLLTTPGNRPFVSSYLPSSSAAAITVVDIPFPQNIPGIPSGVESTDKLPDISLLFEFAAATKLMKPQFEQTLQSLLPNINFMITDDFLGWTLDSANKFRIPRFVYYAMGAFALSVTIAVARGRFLVEKRGNTDLIRVNEFPWIKIEKEDFDPLFLDPEFLGTTYHDFVFENIEASSKSHGIVMNSFYELEPVYIETWSSTIGPPMWCIGPLCLAEEKKTKPENHQKPWWIDWLDQMEEKGGKVLYAAFGTQVPISPSQFNEIKIGLEKSGVNFLWVVRANESQLELGFEKRVQNRGIVVREWVDQREILEHKSVLGFLSQCGSSSMMESISAKVPILALPMMWEQPLNAKFVVEEMKVGLRVETCNRVVKWESLAMAAKELMEGEIGVEVRKNVAEVGGAAVRAVEEGGSSWRRLNQLINELHQTRNTAGHVSRRRSGHLDGAPPKLTTVVGLCRRNYWLYSNTEPQTHASSLNGRSRVFTTPLLYFPM
ncbi:hypothetical protein DH2020_009424 [Rehmannia glutinosa]|uniref:Glycosyltransferase n=1 Tax=Rehmannia glutinosa TaxID=99300 RepID=A0ABR0X8T8_REHGL